MQLFSANYVNMSTIRKMSIYSPHERHLSQKLNYGNLFSEYHQITSPAAANMCGFLYSERYVVGNENYNNIQHQN